jgi:hypothetical protein
LSCSANDRLEVEQTVIENLTEAEWSALLLALESMEDIWDLLPGRERERAALRRAIDKARQLAPSK